MPQALRIPSAKRIPTTPMNYECSDDRYMCFSGDERKRPSIIKMSKQRQTSALAHALPVIAVDDKLSEEDEKEKELIKK